MSRRTDRAPGDRPVRISFLGGLGEIGRNCMAVEHDDRLAHGLEDRAGAVADLAELDLVAAVGDVVQGHRAPAVDALDVLREQFVLGAATSAPQSITVLIEDDGDVQINNTVVGQTNVGSATGATGGGS